jgi:hypothetical protein
MREARGPNQESQKEASRNLQQLREEKYMERFGRIILLTLGLGLTAVALSFFPRRPVVAAPPTPSVPVNVTNTTLPVQGTVAAQQSGAWNVGVTRNVGISNTPNVNANITNTTAIPVSGTLTATIASGATVSTTDGPGTTHLGQDVDSLVTILGPTPSCSTGQQILATGALVPGCFTFDPPCIATISNQCNALRATSSVRDSPPSPQAEPSKGEPT